MTLVKPRPPTSTHVSDVVVELIRDYSELDKPQSSRDLRGFVLRIRSMPHKLMQPGNGGMMVWKVREEGKEESRGTEH